MGKVRLILLVLVLTGCAAPTAAVQPAATPTVLPGARADLTLIEFFSVT